MSLQDTCTSEKGRLVLGTAQLGLPYGIANRIGQPDQTMASAIIREAWKNRIWEFDTAQGYGISEEVLGKAFFQLGISKDVLVVSKFDPGLDHLNTKAMSEALEGSLTRLGVTQLYGMMLHREEVLVLWDLGLGEILHSFVQSGKVRYIGVSVYSPEKAIHALNTEGIDFVQLPTNILDRRFEKAGVFRLANKKEKQLYVRSVFLQGFILMNPNDLPEKMAYARPVLEKLEALCKETGMTRQEMALGYIKREMPDVCLIFGAETPAQVIQNVEYWRKSPPPSLRQLIREAFNEVNERLLNPTLWSN